MRNYFDNTVRSECMEKEVQYALHNYYPIEQQELQLEVLESIREPEFITRRNEEKEIIARKRYNYEINESLQMVARGKKQKLNQQEQLLQDNLKSQAKQKSIKNRLLNVLISLLD